MALFAATLLAASTHGSTPASPLNCAHVHTISNDSLCDRPTVLHSRTVAFVTDLQSYRVGHTAVATVTAVVTVTSLVQDVTGCCHCYRILSL